MGINVHRLSHAIGAEIRGVNIAQPISEETRKEIYQAFLDHCMVVFRGQPITRAQFVTLSSWFGEVDKNEVILRDGVEGYPEISYVLNKPSNDGKPRISYAGQDWHSDKRIRANQAKRRCCMASKYLPSAATPCFAIAISL